MGPDRLCLRGYPGAYVGSASTQSVAQQIAPVNGNGGESAVTDYNAMAVGATGDNPVPVQTTAPVRVMADIAALKDIQECSCTVRKQATENKR